MFKDGKRSGYGSMQIYQKLTDQAANFTGEWKFNKRNGYGEMEWPDKSKYEGEWLNDFRVKGTLTMPDENTYTGEFKNDLMHGIGKITNLQMCTTYEGIFKDGNASNIGRVEFLNDNQIYIGELDKELRKDGVGILIDEITKKRYLG